MQLSKMQEKALMHKQMSTSDRIQSCAKLNLKTAVFSNLGRDTLICSINAMQGLNTVHDDNLTYWIALTCCLILYCSRWSRISSQALVLDLEFCKETLTELLLLRSCAGAQILLAYIAWHFLGAKIQAG